MTDCTQNGFKKGTEEETNVGGRSAYVLNSLSSRLCLSLDALIRLCLQLTSKSLALQQEDAPVLLILKLIPEDCSDRAV